MSDPKHFSGRPRARRLPVWAVVAAALLAALAPRAVQAQGQLVEKVARVQVPIYEDNLDDAKSRAILQGQSAAVMSLVRDLVAPEWIALFDKELRQRVLGRLDRYVNAFRVQRAQASLDRTHFVAMVSAQIDRPQLAAALRELGLPLLSDPPRSLAVLYPAGDPVLGLRAMRTALMDQLTQRLTLLGFKVTGARALSAEAALPLETPHGEAALRARALKHERAHQVLFLQFEPLPAGTAADQQTPGLKAQALLYHRRSGTLLGEFTQEERAPTLRLPLRSGTAQDAVVSLVGQPLINQLLPGSFKSGLALAAGAPPLKLRVMGVTSVEDEDAFERAFFVRNSPFEKFTLYALGGDTVTYEGPYGGDRSTLETDLPGKTFGDFHIRRVYWYNDILELDVQRHAADKHQEMRLFPPEVRTPEVAQLIDDYLSRYPRLEVEDPIYAESEDNGWLNRANRLPFNATLYGFVDSRSDADFYQGQALDSGEELTLVWHRIGRTHLTPAVRLYDERGVPVKTFYPRSWMRYTYKVPPGQHRFYVEIADRFGHLKVDTGGYLSFNYLFKVIRQEPGQPAKTASN